MELKLIRRMTCIPDWILHTLVEHGENFLQRARRVKKEWKFPSAQSTFQGDFSISENAYNDLFPLNMQCD